MRLIKTFESFQDNENILPLIKRLLLLMKKNNLIAFNNIELDDYRKLIIIKGKASIWVRETSILGYCYGNIHGNIHTFFILTNNDGIFDIDVDNIELYSDVCNILKKSIMIIEMNKTKNQKNGSFDFPDTKIEKKEKRLNLDDLKPEVRKTVTDIWNSLENK